MAIYGLLGEHLSYSYSPRIHRALAGYDYRLFEVPKDALDEFLFAAPFDGLNVTIPYKTAVIPFLQGMSDNALAIGSVNTIFRRPDGSLFGDNTDAYGFSQLLKESGLSVSGKKVLVLGSGGASLTVRHVLRQEGADDIVTISRDGTNHYGNLTRHKNAAIVVNTTPVGMFPNNGIAPLSLTSFPYCEGVLDLIYNPARTALMMEATALGIPTFGGLSMLVYQAGRAAELFTDQVIPQERMQQVLSTLRFESENIVLVGMPGCGKTTVGRALAKHLGRNFVDADQYVESKLGCSIPAFFDQHEEGDFRIAEAEALGELGRQSGLVIATGGGCVTCEANYPSLHQNGKLVFIERPLGQLDREGRPLSQGTDLEALYATRLPLYQRFASLSVLNDATPDVVAARIVAVLS